MQVNLNQLLGKLSLLPGTIKLRGQLGEFEHHGMPLPPKNLLELALPGILEDEPRGRATLGHPLMNHRRAQPLTGPPPAPTVTPPAPTATPPAPTATPHSRRLVSTDNLVRLIRLFKTSVFKLQPSIGSPEN